MELRKTIIALLALLVAAMVIVPCVSAEKQKVTGQIDSTWKYSAPEHYIPPDYFKDAKPAVPLPESEMKNFVISESALDKFGQDKKAGIVNIPISFLQSDRQFSESPDYPSRYIENGISPTEPVVLIRMPETMYERFLDTSRNDVMSLPASNFARYYTDLADLDSHVTLKGDILLVSRGEEDTPIPEKRAVDPSVMETNVIPGLNGVKTTVMPLSPQSPGASHDEWAFFTRINTGTDYNYCIGQITPNTWWVSGHNDDYYAPQEREYYLGPSRKEAIEVVINYDHLNSPTGAVKLFPAVYDDHSNTTTDMTDPRWESNGSKIISLDPGTFPHAYGYHIQIYNGKYYIDFEDMDNLSWFDEYIYNDQDNPSTSFTEFAGSSEFVQVTSPITDSFYAVTAPVIDEWVHETYGDWKKPSQVWTFEEQTPNENFVHINWYWGGSGNQELITESSVWSGWA
jgi:hypothetical protein